MASTSESIYRPLDPSRPEIRLLRLHPRQTASPDESLQLTMFTTSLHDQKYFALSYVWGEDTPNNPITINGHSAPVTKNLFEFLLHYRDLTEANSTWELADMLFWVDAICINQEDIPEKNSQVLQMSSIYRSADAVLSWLGVEADDSDYAIEVMIDITGRVAASLDGDDPLSWMAPSQTELWQRNSDGDEMGNKFWDGIVQLVRRSYWTRAWIVQEIVLARKVTMLCGMRSFQFQDLVAIGTWIMRLRPYECPSFVHMNIWLYLSTPLYQENYGPAQVMKYAEIIRLVEEAASTETFNTAYNWKKILIATQTAQASDPRDKLYSMASMLRHGVTPNYSISAEETFCKFAKMCLEADGRLDILLFAGHGFVNDKTEVLGHHLFLPSWVPNWDLLSKARMWTPVPAQMASFDADGFMLKQNIPPLSCYENTLEAPGTHLSEVSTHVYFWGDTKSFAQFWIDYIEAHKDQRDDRGVRVFLTIIRLLLFDQVPDSDMQLGLNPEPSVLERAIAYMSFVLLNMDVGSAKFLQDTRTIQYLDQPIDGTRLRRLLDSDSSKHWSMSSLAQLSSSFIVLRMCYAFFETSQGHRGWGPPGTCKGDIIGILFGCETPVVLRKIDSHYIYIGACYVVGIMDGDPLAGIEKGSPRIKRFKIV
ncbi:heterokaryon incompatibility protein-domain-containing protein [Aspergillus pseudonomiae]|uniref:Heterokaryon incompatibility protein-domain-containing protein n=1 Tax=Aspergillus pseudonomiae TaxID=1506151 RepID=A0A5N6IGN9_9EURO|nr:heterokaryon incompatibility protein-domain-containing protein [Aspergillus pseudonomiae]KAB8265020.1 heterokaryon incompatibility protein-domain-containing protein [Aspergillus pseudonomiae]KAE8400550.1 heterokaryon incompatibility protein-domain-containing protein [Aspergillus pseudonomiae]